MRSLIVALGTLAILTACDKSQDETITERTQADHVTTVKADDPAMLRAFSKARETLDGFLTLAASRDSNVASPALKVKIEDNGAVEYFWIVDFSATPTGYSGQIDNDPEFVRNVKLGQVWSFSISEIYDWTYVDKKTGRMMGNFTMCALLTHESAESAAEFKKTYHLDCDT